MNVKRGFKPTAEPTITKEKLKNPQQAKTRAVESQEGLKLVDALLCGLDQYEGVESQEGLKLVDALLCGLDQYEGVESQEGLKPIIRKASEEGVTDGRPRISRRVETYNASH
jgi:hypothetical protein